MKRISTVLIGIAVIFCGSVFKVEAGLSEMSIVPAYNILLSPDFSDYDDDDLKLGGIGFTVQGFLGTFNLGKNVWDWGLETGYIPMMKLTTTMSGVDVEGKAYSVPVIGLARYNFNSSGDIKPYALIGAGFYYSSSEVTFSGSGITMTMGSDELELGLTLGGGARKDMDNGLFADGLFRYTRILNETADPDDADDDGYEDSISGLSIGVAIGKYF